jgi:hypothetical protein
MSARIRRDGDDIVFSSSGVRPRRAQWGKRFDSAYLGWGVDDVDGRAEHRDKALGRDGDHAGRRCSIRRIQRQRPVDRA